MPDASIIIPVFNEEVGLKKVVGQINELLKRSEEGFEVIFVNDGSTDNSLNIINGFDVRNFRIISHKTNNGYGAALKTGIKHARYDTIIITDADCTYPIEKIATLLEVYRNGNHDMVVGSRNRRNVQMPLTRKPAKWCLKCLAEYLAARKIPDLNSGLRVMRKNVVEQFMNILPNGFSFTTTITLAMLTNNYSVEYVDINYKFRRGNSKIRPLHDTVNFLQLIIRTTLYFDPLKIFVPLSLFLVVVAFTIFLLSWFFLERIMDVSFGVCLMAAVIVMSIGMLADLIDKRMR
jgi:glycosyltransferase involved in cell wall biosynthesis